MRLNLRYRYGDPLFWDHLSSALSNLESTKLKSKDFSSCCNGQESRNKKIGPCLKIKNSNLKLTHNSNNRKYKGSIDDAYRYDVIKEDDKALKKDLEQGPIVPSLLI